MRNRTERKLIVRLGTLLVLVTFITCLWTTTNVTASRTNGLLSVSFLDIGQGDAIFVETPDGIQLLVDGGPNGAVLSELGKIMSWSDHTIDMIIGTHPDSDHIGGLVDVLKRYTVGTILTTENSSKTNTFKSFRIAVIKERDQEHAAVINARTGQIFQLGASTTVRVLSPAINPTGWETNRSSIVVQVVYGSTTIMLTGDAPQAIEEHLVSVFGSDLQSDVLKPGHHGSRTATGEDFVTAVHPTYAVISAGKHNRYGHPTQEVMNRLRAHGIIVYSTIDDGTVRFYSDGTTIVPAQSYARATTLGSS